MAKIPSFKGVSIVSVMLSMLMFTGCGKEAHSDLDLTGGHATEDPHFLPATIIIWGNCTAAKVGRRLFLTAAHCVIDFNTRQLSGMFRPGSQIHITNHKNPTAAGHYPWSAVTIEYTHFAPSYIEQCHRLPCPNTMAIDGADVAVFKIREDTPHIHQTWVDWNHEIRPNDSLIITGFGCEDGLNGRPTSGAGRFKFQFTRALNVHGVEHGWYAPYRDRIYSWNVLTPGLQFDSGSASLCFGDSGGPLYRNDGSGAIVGVNAYYSFSDSSPGISRTNWHTRLTHPSTSSWLYHEITRGAH